MRRVAKLRLYVAGDNVPATEQMELKAVASLANSSSTQNLTTLLAKVPATSGTFLFLVLGVVSFYDDAMLVQQESVVVVQ